MKKNLYIAALFIAVLFSSCQKEEETEPAKLQQMAVETNKLLPKRLDEVTMLDSVSAKAMQFSYNYTLEYNKDSLDFDIKSAKVALSKNAQSGIDTIKSFQEFKHQISFKYIYYDKNGAYLFDYTVRTKTKQKHN